MTTLTGQNCFHQLLKDLRRRNPQRLFLVTGKNSFHISSARNHVFDCFDKKKISTFSDFTPNVKLEDVVVGCQEFETSGSDCILAVGGGSVLDMAKMIRVCPPDEDLIVGMINHELPIKSKSLLYCAPTTAGSGSEATHFAVVYIDGKKFSLAHEAILPDFVAVDPLLSSSMSPYLTACSGFDALCHSIESFWSKGANEHSRTLSENALSLMLSSIQGAVNSPTEKTRANMAKGSNLAGKSINITKTTAPHALSYYLTSRFGIAHGHAVALVLGYFFSINEARIPGSLYKILGTNSADECRIFWHELMKNCLLETNLIHLGLSQKHLEDMVRNADVERLSNNPVSLSKSDLLKFVDLVLDRTQE